MGNSKVKIDMRKKINTKIYTLGCKINQYDSDFIKKKLGDNFIFTTSRAELILINTCAVTKSAIAKARNAVRREKRENPNAKIILMGCWPMVYRDEAIKIGADLVWGVGKLEKLVLEILTLLKQNFSKNNNVNDLKIDKSRYFIKVQEGCEQYCTYCVIPQARGSLSSRSKDEIIYEIENAVDRGYREIVLCGTHLGLYGAKGMKDVPAELFSLLIDILAIKDVGRIRLSSIELNEVTDEILDLMSGNKRLCQHLHIPLQSGNDKILKLMNRPYLTENFLEKINKIRCLMPDIAITTDVIVGFPGETDEDFEITCNFVKSVNFSKIHVFSFSAHEKTPAYSMKNQNNRNEIYKRARILRKISNELENQYFQKFLGRTLDVIIEKSNNKEIVVGKTEYYFDVLENRLLDNHFQIGSMVKMKVK